MSHNADRRSGIDRRQLETGFFGALDRRRMVEPRKLQVAELSLSEAEWQVYFSPSASTALQAADETAQILDRATRGKTMR